MSGDHNANQKAQEQSVATSSMEPFAYGKLDGHWTRPEDYPHRPDKDLFKLKFYSAEQLTQAVATECQRLDDNCANLQAEVDRLKGERDVMLKAITTEIIHCSDEHTVTLLKGAIAKIERK